MALLIAYLVNVEKTASCTNIGFTEILHPVDDGRTRSEGDTVIIGLTYSANSGHVVFFKDVLSEIYDE